MRWLMPLVVLLVMVSVTCAQHWKWTEPAEHHKSVVAVLAGNAGGTGVHIGNGFLLTAAHVAETQSGYVTFPNGNRYAWRMARRHYVGDIDLAVLYSAECAGEPWARVAQEPSRHGEMIELVGLGGPGPNNDGASKTYRHFEMQVLSETNDVRLVTSGVVTYGDSGAPSFNSRGEVVGIQSAGRRKIDVLVSSNGAKWDALTPALLTNVGPIRKLLGWGVQAQGCYGGQCGPQQGYAGGGGGGKAQGWYPPQQQAGSQQGGAIPEPPAAPQPDAIAQTPPAQVSPQAPAACDPACQEKCDGLQSEIDKIKEQVASLDSKVDQVAKNQIGEEDLAASLAAVIQANPDRFRGPEGPPGKDAKIDLPHLASLVEAQLPPITIRTDDRLPGHVVHLGGEVTLPPIRFHEVRENDRVKSVDVPLGGYLEIVDEKGIKGVSPKHN